MEPGTWFRCPGSEDVLVKLSDPVRPASHHVDNMWFAVNVRTGSLECPCGAGNSSKEGREILYEIVHRMPRAERV